MCSHNCRQLLTKHFVDSHILNCVYRVKQGNYYTLSNWCDEKWAGMIEMKLDKFKNPFRHYRLTNILSQRKNYNFKNLLLNHKLPVICIAVKKTMKHYFKYWKEYDSIRRKMIEKAQWRKNISAIQNAELVIKLLAWKCICHVSVSLKLDVLTEAIVASKS